MERRKRAVASIIALILVFSILVTGSGFNSIVYAESDIASDTDAQEADGLTDDVAFNIGTYKGDNYEVSFVIDSKWDNGFNATITISNTGVMPIENWCMPFPLEQEISNIWNASVEETYDDFYIIKNVGWNQDIPVNGSISFGITSYDELIIEADKRMSLDAVCEQMGRTPPWAEGLLLRADGYETDFYKKD